MDFVEAITDLVKLGQLIILENPGLNQETGQINSKGDRTLQIDKKVETAFLKYLKKHNLPFRVYSEEIGELDIHPHPEYLITVDPLDGSANYRYGRRLLPYGFLLSIYRGLTPTISDVIISAAIETTQNLGFIYSHGQTRDLSGNEIVLKEDWTFGSSTPVHLDLHRRVYYQTYQPLVEKLYIHNSGSTVGNLVLVLSNASAATGHPRIKAEEIGAFYSLITGAGGVVSDHVGNDLGHLRLSFSDRYQALGGSRPVVNFMQNLLAGD